MAHPTSSPSCNGSGGVHSSPTASKALPSVISHGSVQSQNNRSAGHHVQWSDPLVHTRGIPRREPQGANSVLATVTPSVTSNYSSQQDTGTIAGGMEGLKLAPSASSASTAPSAYRPPPQTFLSLCPQLTSTSQAAHQGSAPRNPNLRFIVLRRLLATQAREPLNPIDSNESPATEPQSLMPVISEAVLNQSNGNVKSTTDVNGTPPPTSTVMEDSDVIDLTLRSDEENSLLQKQPKNQKSTQKQRNVSIESTLLWKF
ncbi:hypothetical protein F4604DRAFT_52217 [Suillus subluteus]|nr:hypothetical protein F4604DRAFT_52217 [Suillus subluteus]